MNRGVVYIAFGQAYLAEMELSIRSLKQFHPDMPITVFSDTLSPSLPVIDWRPIAPSHLRPKVDHLSQTPYEQTLFLDTDTIIASPIDDMFEILPKFDLGLCHDLARKRERYSRIINEYSLIPYAYPELNTGVIVFQKNQKTTDLFHRWNKLFYRYLPDVPWDQPTFRVAVWQSSANLHVFPTEYNIRSKANRKKQDRLHHEFGDEHLRPRIFHMHADPKIQKGRYRIKSVRQALNFCRRNFFPY